MRYFCVQFASLVLGEYEIVLAVRQTGFLNEISVELKFKYCEKIRGKEQHELKTKQKTRENQLLYANDKTSE